MFVITLSNMFVTETGLAGPADRTDRCLDMIDTHSFGYRN
jgi:hypothetical protein